MRSSATWHDIALVSTFANKVLALDNGNIPIYGAFSRLKVGYEDAKLYGWFS